MTTDQLESEQNDKDAMVVLLPYHRIRYSSTAQTLKRMVGLYRDKHRADADIVCVAVPKGSGQKIIDAMAGNFRDYGIVKDERSGQ